MNRLNKVLFSLVLLFSLTGCKEKKPVITETPGPVIVQGNNQSDVPPEEPIDDPTEDPVGEPEYLYSEDTECDDMPCVAYYIYTYEHLPANYMTKKEARKKGWEAGPLWQTIEGMCIGGDYFGNNEGILPDVKGRKYYECDIDTLGKKKRGSKRIIYSSDGQVYYTEDHYESFELIYGEEE